MKPKFPTKYIAFTTYFGPDHQAVDIPNGVTVNGIVNNNKPVYMTHDGKVITNSYASDYGHFIEYEYIGEDGAKYIVGDGHFNTPSGLQVGQTYPQGTFIHNMGNTGTSYSTHDHHRLTRNGTRVNPLDYEYVYPDQIVGQYETAKLKYYTPIDETMNYIQNTLNVRYDSRLNIDGKYGTNTKKALVKGLQIELDVQYDAGLKVDSAFGVNTKNKCPILKQGDLNNIVWLVQAMLYCKKYQPKGIDKNYGKNTTETIKKFQQDNGLTQDGLCGKNTFEKLFN